MLRTLPVCLLLLIFGFICSCENGQKSQNSQVNADSLQTQLIILNDSVNQAWQVLVTSDQTREQSLKDLLEQISGLKNFNKSLYNSLVNEQAELPKLRYASPAAITSTIIDTYDAKSDEVKSGIYQLGNATQGYAACAVCGELMEKIDSADNQTLFNRINYDRQAQAYNAFVKENKVDLATIKSAYENLTPLPLFQIAL